MNLRPFIISQESGAQAVLNMELKSEMRTRVRVVHVAASSSTWAHTALSPERKFESPSGGAVLERSELCEKIRAIL